MFKAEEDVLHPLSCFTIFTTFTMFTYLHQGTNTGRYQGEGLLTFRNRNHFVTFQKSNKIGPAFVWAICNELKISYKDFRKILFQDVPRKH